MSGCCWWNVAKDCWYALATWSSQSRKVTVVPLPSGSVPPPPTEQPASRAATPAASRADAVRSRFMGFSSYLRPVRGELLEAGDGDRPDDVPLEDQEQHQQRQGGQVGGGH